MRDEESSLNDTLEGPALWLPVGDSLEGLSVLDLGWGFGNFARKHEASARIPLTLTDGRYVHFPKIPSFRRSPI